MTHKIIKQGDSEFHFVDGFTIVPRASFEISEVCPSNMRLMIHRAVADGYLRLNAYVPDEEYMWEKLKL